MSSTETPPDPHRIGPYIIEEKIGSGGMGTVYRARHHETGQTVAVKVLPANMARQPGFVARFNREVESMRQLKNPHVVDFYESGVDENETYYYTMEYIEGETIADRLRREKRIGWRETTEYAIQICAALKAAHDAGIVHRDLKPSNLLLASDGTVKLTDFGVAQMFAAGKLTVTGGIIGTAEYMSPEQAQGRRATKSSDLYSLGAVMYAMITGRPPFTGKSTVDVVQKQKYGRFDMPSRYAPDLPHWLEEIICCLLEKEPEKRYPDAYVTGLRLKEVLKKIELSSSEQTVASFHDASTPTAGLDDPNAVGGTLMRDLMQAEIERAAAPSPWAALLNSTWVLVGILVLVVLGGIAFFNRGSADGESEPINTTARSDPERFLEMARHFERLGDFGRAERTLSDLLTIIGDDEQWSGLRKRAELRLKRLRKRRSASKDPPEVVSAALKRAEEKLKRGDVDEARAIWQAVIDLYGSDPSAQNWLYQIRNRLESTPARAP